MSEKHNERREDAVLRSMYEAIVRVGQDCQDQHVETQKTLDGIVIAQTVFSVKIQGIEQTLDRIGSKVDKTSERTASTETSVNALKDQTSKQDGKITKLENRAGMISNKGTNDNPVKISFVDSDNFKYAIFGGLFSVLLVLVAFGAITMRDVAQVTQLGGGG